MRYLEPDSRINLDFKRRNGYPSNRYIPDKQVEDGRFEDYEYLNEEEEDEEEDEPRRGQLDRWDRGARIWLSSGTMFLLVILFHVIQVRNDLRRFTSTANIQMHEACSLLEDKTISLKTALSFAAQDIGPISFKFVRDLKTKLRAAFHFAGQIFGGRVREALVGLFKKYYCLLVGVLVTFDSFLKEGVKWLLSHLPEEHSFVHEIYNFVQKVVEKIADFIARPEKAFGDLFSSIMGEIFDVALTMIPLPTADTNIFNDACSTVKQIDFVEIDRLLKGYMAKIIAIVAVILILYNSFQYAKVVGNKEDEAEAAAPSEELTIKVDSRNVDGYFLMNCGRWLIGFFSYPPFWVFLSMGVFGWLHIKFSCALQSKADQMKTSIIDPAIDELKEVFTSKLSEYLMVLEDSWSRAFTDLIRPITDFITKLSEFFKPILDTVVKWGKEVLRWIQEAVNFIEMVTLQHSIAVGVSAVLDCFIAKSFKSWVLIADIIKTKLFGVKWSEMRGGIVALLHHSINSIFIKLNITKHFKRLFSLHLAMYLKLITKRSIFLYVYLIVCALLIAQGLLMFIIKFLLGCF